jgi:thiosulfate reductase cytochrome b subunit
MPDSSAHPTSAKRPVYEHPWAVRFSHWANAVTVTVLTMSGLQIFNAFQALARRSPRSRGVWPMARHYFLFGPKPPSVGQYNPLQKLAYTSTLVFGAVSLLTGLVMYKPVQLSALGWLFGGYHGARLMHFLAMCGMLAFIPGHLIMVAVHGWDNFASMATGWKRRSDTAAQENGR